MWYNTQMFKRKPEKHHCHYLDLYFDVIELRTKLMTLEDQVAQIAADVAEIKANPVAVDLTAVNAKLDAILSQFQTTPEASAAQ